MIHKTNFKKYRPPPTNTQHAVMAVLENIDHIHTLKGARKQEAIAYAHAQPSLSRTEELSMMVCRKRPENALIYCTRLF